MGKPKTSTSSLNRVISSFLREMVAVESLEDSYEGFVRILKSILDFNWYLIALENEGGYKVVHHFNAPDFEELESYAFWVAERKSVSFFTLENEELLVLIPFIFRGRVLAVMIVGANQGEIDVELEDTIKIFALIAANTLANLILADQLKERNAIIEESRRFLNLLLDSFSDQIAVYDVEREIVYMNEAFKKAERSEDLEAEIAGAVEESALRKESITKEYETSDGRFYSIETIPLRLEGEERILLIVSDITGTKELERIKKIDRMKTEFVANVSHEIRTPLAAIKAYTETLLYSFEDLDSETLQEFLDTILKQSEHLESIVEELLDFSRIESGTLKVEKEKTDIVSLTKEVLNKLQAFAEKNGVKIEFESEVDECLVEIDSRQFRKVINNLVSNAIKYSDKEKSDRWVKISVYPRDSEVEIIVADNGIGIPEHVGDRIFQRYYRVDSKLTYEVSGTGLGLTITKEIVEAHGGQIWYESVEKMGTTFHVVIPR